MALTAKWVYTNNQAATITIASLANFGLAISNAIDNTSSGYMSMDLQVQIRTGGTVSTGGLYDEAGVGIYLLRTTDGSTSGVFDTVLGPGQAVTTAATIKANNPELLQILYTPAINTTYKSSIRIENLPAIFKFMVYNGTGGTLDSTGSNHYIKYASKVLQVF
ncbi:hypothetical protein [Nitrospira sp. BLG_2]|uniref:hypothetical protein n=1 Tax=Nitrospira sp. BLG_2 TaxID=3397507 RepID=UPI003B9A87DC